MSDNPDETAYYLRLLSMFMDLGTEAVLEVFVFHSPGRNAEAFLKSKEETLTKMMKDRILNRQECDLLFEKDKTRDIYKLKGIVDLKRFDISLIITLSINLFDENQLTPPKKGWENPPRNSDKSIAADLLRLRTTRNVIVGHYPKAQLAKWCFDEKWEEVSKIILRIRQQLQPGNETVWEKRINSYRLQTLDPTVKNMYDGKLREWHEDVSEVQDQVEDLLKKLEGFDAYFKNKCDRYERYIKLLVQGGGFVMRAFITEQTKRQGRDLREMLDENEDTIKAKIADVNDLAVLYPSESSSDVQTLNTLSLLNVSALETVILQVFGEAIGEATEWAVRTIGNAYRNYAENALVALDSNTFEDFSSDLKASLRIVSENLNKDQAKQYYRILDECKKNITENEFKTYVDELRTQGKHIRTFTDIFKETLKKTKEFLQDMITHGISFKYSHELDLKMITLGSSEEKKQLAEYALTEIWHEALGRSVENPEFADVKKEVENIIEEIRKLRSVTNISVIQACIILKISCTSPSDMLHMINYFESSEFQESLDIISKELGYHFNTVFAIQAFIPVDTLWSIQNQQSDLAEVKEEGIRVPISVESPADMLKLRSLINNEKIANSTNSIADALSKHFSEKITLKVETDMKTFTKIFDEGSDSSSDSTTSESSHIIHSNEVDKNFEEESHMGSAGKQPEDKTDLEHQKESPERGNVLKESLVSETDTKGGADSTSFADEHVVADQKIQPYAKIDRTYKSVLSSSISDDLAEILKYKMKMIQENLARARSSLEQSLSMTSDVYPESGKVYNTTLEYSDETDWSESKVITKTEPGYKHTDTSSLPFDNEFDVYPEYVKFSHTILEDSDETDLSGTFSESDVRRYRNWIRAGLCFREGMKKIYEEFDYNVKRMHHDLIQDVRVKKQLITVSCNQCSLHTLRPDHVQNGDKQCPLFYLKCNCLNPSGTVACPNKVCGALYDRIIEQHLSIPPAPFWENTNVQKWCTEPWSIAKCFINKPGYKEKTQAADIRMDGLVLLHSNCRAIRSSAILGEHIYKASQLTMGRNQLGIQRVPLQPLWTYPSESLEDDYIVTTADEASVHKDVISMLSEEVNQLKHKKTVEAQGQIDHIEKLLSANRQKMEYIEQKQDLQRRLVELYGKGVTRVPTFPLQLENNQIGIEDAYVDPWMTFVYDEASTSMKSEEKEISSFFDIFGIKGKDVKTVYVLGEANSGKSVFCRNLVQKWCKRHVNEATELDEDVTAMTNYDFLFFVFLRHHLDKSTIEMMIESQFDHPVLNKILEKESDRCLILLDGLDEWNPLLHNQPSFAQSALPARDPNKDYTVIITSRPWKINSIGIAKRDIPAKIMLRGIKKRASDLLIEHTITLLNERFRKDKNAADFRKYFRKCTFSEVENIPILLQQLVCLWYENSNLTTFSRCSIYLDMLLLAFNWLDHRTCKGLEKASILESKPSPTLKVSHILGKFQMYDDYKQTLSNISRLAYELFEVRENSFSIGSQTFKRLQIDDEVIRHSVDVGILTKDEETCCFLFDRRNVSSFSFVHKSVKEFLVALHIALNYQSCQQPKSDGGHTTKPEQENTSFSEPTLGYKDLTVPQSESNMRGTAHSQFMPKWDTGTSPGLKVESKRSLSIWGKSTYQSASERKDRKLPSEDKTRTYQLLLSIGYDTLHSSPPPIQTFAARTLPSSPSSKVRVTTHPQPLPELEITTHPSLVSELEDGGPLLERKMPEQAVSEETSISEQKEQQPFLDRDVTPQETLDDTLILEQESSKYFTRDMPDMCSNFFKQYFVSIRTTDDISELANVFIFLAGLEPSLVIDISKFIYNIVNKDSLVTKHRTTLEECKFLLDIQKCISRSCFEAGPNVKTEVPNVYLGDLFLDDLELDYKYFNSSTVTNIRQETVQSLTVSLSQICSLKKGGSVCHICSILRHLSLCDRLKVLKLNNKILAFEDAHLKLIVEIVNNNYQTLRVVSYDFIFGGRIYQSEPLTEIKFLIPTLHQLTSLKIYGIELSHKYCSSLTYILSGDVFQCLRELSLNIKCGDQSDQLIDLSKHRNLRYLEIGDGFTVTRLSTKHDMTVKFKIKQKDSALIMRLLDILNSVKLKHVRLWGSNRNIVITPYLGRLIDTSPYLCVVELDSLTIEDNILVRPYNLRNLNLIELSSVTMTEYAWKIFTKCLLEIPQTVQVKVMGMRDLKWSLWKDIPNIESRAFVKSKKDVFDVTRDERYFFEFSTKKNDKTEEKC